jgi:CheY-like chemotaxis protein
MVSMEDGVTIGQSSSNLAALRVLVIEDNEMVASSLATLLQRSGHRVDVAHTGAAALEAASVCPPHVALVDIDLPDMDGYAVAGHFRGQESLREVVLVALSGYNDDETRRLGEQAGFICHLAKPVDIVRLRGVLARAAGRDAS